MSVSQKLANNIALLIILIVACVGWYLWVSSNLESIQATIRSNQYLSWMLPENWNIQAIISAAGTAIIGFIIRHVFAVITIKQKDRIINTYETMLKALGINPSSILQTTTPQSPSQVAPATLLTPAVAEQLKKAGIPVPPTRQMAPPQTQPQPQQPSEKQQLIEQAQKLISEGKLAEAQKLLQQAQQAGEGKS